MVTKYTFETTATAYEFKDEHRHQPRGRTGSSGSNNSHGNHHRRGGSDGHSTASGEGDPLDGNGSLTYSAASSINSGAGESTDSSFADIMRVLDVQDSRELASYLKREKGMFRSGKDEKSVAAESLAYSTDAESHLRSLATDGAESALHGADLISTITGRSNNNDPMNLFAPERTEQDCNDPFGTGASSSNSNDDLDILFSPAEHTDSLKRRKDRKRRERRERRAAAAAMLKNNDMNTSTGGSSSGTPRMKNSSQHHLHNHHSAPSSGNSNMTPPSSGNYQNYSHHKRGAGESSPSSAILATPSPNNSKLIESRQGTPPPTSRPPKKHNHNGGHHYGKNYSKGHSMEFAPDDEDVWYAKWWMFCFPDTVKNMTEQKR